jgi:hypothetical protein
MVVRDGWTMSAKLGTKPNRLAELGKTESRHDCNRESLGAEAKHTVVPFGQFSPSGRTR